MASHSRTSMGSLTLCAAALAASTGCSEYGLNTELPRVDACADIVHDPLAVVQLDTCAREPEVGAFDPVVEWSWTENALEPGADRVEVPPTVIELNGDGIPDIVFTAFSETNFNGTGSMVAISGADGRTLWSHASFEGAAVWSLSTVAAVRVGGEVSLFVGVEGGVARVNSAGSAVWVTPAASWPGGWVAPAVGDIEGDGIPEIAVGSQVLAFDGTLLRAAEADDVGHQFPGSFLADIDADGRQELVAAAGVFDDDFTPLWVNAERYREWPALGDLDGKGSPELVSATTDVLRVANLAGQELWHVALEGSGGGPPTIADFDGDGMAEIGIACKPAYRVFEGDGTLLWEQPILEASSGFTGSAVFDFEGDGAAEVVYADERTLWVFDGATGAVELEFGDHNSGTRFEYPTIADVDGDGHAEIILPHGRAIYGMDVKGISVLGSASGRWQPARPIWNQYAYFISNVLDDGSLPTAPTPSWLGANSFRAGNSERAPGLGLPDIEVGNVDPCFGECGSGRLELFVPVSNRGQVAAHDVDIVFERVDAAGPTTLVTVPLPLLDAGASTWVGPISVEEQDFGELGLVIRAVPTEAFGSDDTYECDPSNNKTVLLAWPC